MANQYIIPQISALSLLVHNKSTTLTDHDWQNLIERTVQDDCPIFYQARKLMGRDKPYPGDEESLYDVFVYIDFSGIFDRKPVGQVLELQKKAEELFRPEGVELDIRFELKHYVAFERSASMGRANRLAFVRKDIYEKLREHMMLGMEIGKCQLSKLYAYNALMFTDGDRITSGEFLNAKHIIVIDNPKTLVRDVPVITVTDDGSLDAMRTYRRIQDQMDVEVLEFDGEGLVSKELAPLLCGYEGEHHSFQIRLPYIKGVVHEVDYKRLFHELKISEVTDIWGERHRIDDVDLVLTKSMFKGFGWMTENGLTWAEYLERCRKYGHALYVSGRDKPEQDGVIDLNYQFLITLAISEEEFRPSDLPLGWDHSPEDDPRQWLTKTTETTYYNLMADEKTRLSYFTRRLLGHKPDHPDDRWRRAELLQKHPEFIHETIFTKELSDHAERIRKGYALGQLLVAGDNRYLSDDLMRLLAHMTGSQALWSECLDGNQIYAPQPCYLPSDHYTVLRSPHIARNEEALVTPLPKAGHFRKKYLSHLNYVLMVDSRSLIPERLGGADYDGDMVKTVADPMLNQCVLRSFSDGMPPVLKIPAAEPLISDANDWQARFETVKRTFSSRVGQISNAAMRRGVIAYNENSSPEAQQRYREETETLSILTGLEIDSAKSGVKPDLSAYLGNQSSVRNVFLRYKAIAGDDDNRKWYESTKQARLKAYFASVDWRKVSSNLEKLPYYAHKLKEDTVLVQPEPADDAALFLFAQDPDWKTKLDPQAMQRMQEIISAYEEAQRRCRMRRFLPDAFPRRKDIVRILYARGQEELYDVDYLYSLLENVNYTNLQAARRMLTEQAWHLTPPEDRRTVFYRIGEHLRNIYRFEELFCDFRCGGYRVLGDLICDWDDYLQREGIENHLIYKDDGEDLQHLLYDADRKRDIQEYLISQCSSLLGKANLTNNEDVKCAAALGKRRFILEVMPGAILAYEQLQEIHRKAEKRADRRAFLRRLIQR
ncbi:MAG: hypothetical protein IJH52_05835 [Oscillospiraceae bacterium]|nr:hypothetical protein [Oscillospiraceae bacterium]